MNELNRIGIRVMGIIVVVLLVIVGIWKGIALGISEYQTTKTPEITVSPTPIAYPSPETTLTPELQQELSTFVDTTKETLVGYTKKYVESLPTDIPKDQVLDSKKVEAFVLANQGTLLPELFAGTLQTTTKSGKQAIQTYLDAISPVQNPAIKPITGDMITEALAKQESGEDLQALVAIRASIENNFTIFKSVKAPKEATELHTKLLQATLALMNNITLLQNMKTDFIGGLIGQKNLADLNAVFTDIGTQILALETKYNIK
ncbi:MAG TPA: hypothetical protein VJI96_01590 [Candidatus Andersenbacteria bacterium]|nr:hypothetical protein [Candidatus Andersenbacteria bacterium]